MVGKTGTIYYRGMHAWKGALILMLARGGWMNTTHGNLELIGDSDAHWFARVQSLYLHFQSEGRIKTFGGIPGDVQTYGFGALDARWKRIRGSESRDRMMAKIRMPLLSQAQKPLGAGTPALSRCRLRTPPDRRHDRTWAGADGHGRFRQVRRARIRPWHPAGRGHSARHPSCGGRVQVNR